MLTEASAALPLTNATEGSITAPGLVAAEKLV